MVPIFTFATSSITIGVAASLYFAVVSNMQVLAPDFTKGVFLEMLLEDKKVAKKINDDLSKTCISVLYS